MGEAAVALAGQCISSQARAQKTPSLSSLTFRHGRLRTKANLQKFTIFIFYEASCQFLTKLHNYYGMPNCFGTLRD